MLAATNPFVSALAMAVAMGCRLCCSAAEASASRSSLGRVALSTRCTLELALCQRARLVENNCLHARQTLKRIRTLKQHPRLGG